MANLTNEEKNELANSSEVLVLYSTLVAVQTTAVNRIREAVDGGNYDSAAIKKMARETTDKLKPVLQYLFDGICNPGEHWDESVGGCVPDSGVN